MFLAPLTARSKVREVLRGLVATRQVHTLALGHAPHFYVAGTLPEFAAPPTAYASSSMPASTYFLRSYEHEEEGASRCCQARSCNRFHAAAEAGPPRRRCGSRPSAQRQLAGKPPAARPQFSHPPARTRSRKPAQSSASGRVARRAGRDVRAASARSSGARSSGAPAMRTLRAGRRARQKTVVGTVIASAMGRTPAKTPPMRAASMRTAMLARPGTANGASGHAQRRSLPRREVCATATLPPEKAPAKSVSRRAGASRKDARSDARTARSSRKPALTAATKAGNRTRYGFTAPSRQRTKKRG